MRPITRTLRPLGAALLAMVLATTAAVPAPAATPRPDPATPSAHEVTLITGDRVRVSADQQQVQTIPGPGREQVRFSTHRSGGRLSVVPSDALTLLGSKRLDPRLFDITELLATGSAGSLPLIITYAGTPAAASSTLRDSGATAERELPAINGRAARIPEAELPELFGSLTKARKAASGIDKIWLDGRRKLLLDHSVPQIGAPETWAAGYTGRGVKVAVLDSGVDAAHPDFAGRLQSANFTPDGPEDANGHATHVASIVGGSGAASDGKYKGVAPDAELLSGKVCVYDGCSDSWVLAGMDWAVQQGAKVVNLSLGGYDGPGLDPLEQAVDTLSTQYGTLFVVAAGNDGPADGTIGSPGSAAAALTVGAVDRDDRLAEFSSRGPTVDDGAPKPDVTAPGVDIVAAKASNSQIGDPVGTSYLRLSGTSMATPHVAGAAALLAQQHPDWKAPQLKAALMGSAIPASGVPVDAQGRGRIDVAAATKLPVTSDNGALAFDAQRWPHTDDVAQSKEITYSNPTAAAVSLDLAASFTGPDGKPAPASAVRLSASTVSVPAHGTAKVVVTSDTNFAGPDGRYAGSLVARAGAATLTTTLSVQREQESYDLTIKHLDRTGATTADYLDMVVDRDTENWPLYLRDEDGVTNIRLPRGHYLLDSTIGTERDAAESSNLVQPKLDLTSDQTITIDARQAKPVSITVPDPTARNAFTTVSYTLQIGAGSWRSGIGTLGSVRLFTAQLGPSVPELSGEVRSQWARPDPDGGEFFDNTPYIYALLWTSDGYYNGVEKVVRQSDLATVKPNLAAQAAGTEAVWSVYGAGPVDSGGTAYGYPYNKLPTTPSVYVTTEDVTWSGNLIYTNGDLPAAFMYSAATGYRPGRTYRENWGRAAIGPAFPQHRTWVSRAGDTLTLLPPQADGAGHYDQGVAGSGTMDLYRDGTKLATLDYPFQAPKDIEYVVPAGPAAYRLDVQTTGSGVLDMSTSTQTSWTFKSTTGTTALPLWAVRFLPGVDDHNVLKTGRTHVLPIVAQAQHGAAVGQLKTVKVQTSTDDGETWRNAPVRSTGGGKFAAVVTVPAGSTYVSVRAQAADSKGNTVKETITRAYKVAR